MFRVSVRDNTASKTGALELVWVICEQAELLKYFLAAAPL